MNKKLLSSIIKQPLNIKFLILILVLPIGFISQFTSYNLNTLSSYKTIIKGEILNIYDGDTLTIIDNETRQKHRIRLYGIDAPESKQRYGKESTQNLQKYCQIKQTAKIKVKNMDKYGRIVGLLECNNNNIDVNAMMVKDGYAWAYTQYGGKAYLAMETYAKAAKKGLWQDENPINPAIFRKNEKLKQNR